MLLLAGGRGSLELFRCEYTGVVQASCCCPEHDAQSDGVPILSRACCCRIEHLDASLPAGMAGSSKLIGAASPLLICSASSVLPPPRLSPSLRAYRIPERHRERTRAGPPLTIAHRRLLI
jgi:hypothetical protein